MQKLSACRNRGSSIHFFSSTIMRCIMAIWPAGPPKLMQPILSQSQKNSVNDGRVCCSIVMPCVRCRPVRQCNGRRVGALVQHTSSQARDQQNPGYQQQQQDDAAKAL